MEKNLNYNKKNYNGKDIIVHLDPLVVVTVDNETSDKSCSSLKKILDSCKLNKNNEIECQRIQNIYYSNCLNIKK